MSLFKKLFGSKSDKSEEEFKSNERGKYMPEIKLPIDERFTINFKSNGGKFLYCENLDEIYQSLDNIILENDWKDKKVLLLDQSLAMPSISSFNLGAYSESICLFCNVLYEQATSLPSLTRNT